MEHLLVKFKTNNSTSFNSVWLSNNILESVRLAGCTTLRFTEHDFYPKGYSAAVILSESHISLHTWQEDDAIYIDFFTCQKKPKFDKFLSFWEKLGMVIDKATTVDRETGKVIKTLK